MITNIYEEHLDHYKDFHAYVAAKFNIVKYQTEENFYIIKKDVNYYMDFSKLRAKRIQTEQNREFYDLTENLKGKHNKADIDYAVTVVKLLNVEDEFIKKALNDYKGLEHRMEKVGTFNEITFYNDAIATVPKAVIYAIDALKEVDTLIFGGMDRKINYSDFIEVLKNSNIRNFICMPETGNKIGKELEKYKNVFYLEKMQDVVKKAYEVTEKGKICLMSPAAPSYNRYRDFEEKGRKFKEYIRKFGN